MNNKKSVIAVLANLDFIISSAALAILVVLTFLGVIWRYCLRAPFVWLEEVQLACMVWIVFLGAGAAFRTGNHVAIEMVADLLPEKLQKAVTVLVSAIVVIVIGYLFIQSIGYIQMFQRSGRTTNILDIPYTYIYGIAIISYIDMIVSYFYSVIKGVKSEAKEAAEGDE